MSKMVKEVFIPGDEWISYKIYTEYHFIERILIKTISPIVQRLLTDGIIDKWFFVRYKDENFHLRVRFHCTEKNSIYTVQSFLNRELKKYIDANIVWDVHIDSYKRELVRYGEHTINQSEQLFFYDSEKIIKLIELLSQSENSSKLRWLLSIKIIDQLLSTFKYDINEKEEVLRNLSLKFAKEFHINSQIIKQLSQKYRINKRELHNLLEYDLFPSQSDGFNAILLHRNLEEIKLAGEITAISNLKKEKYLTELLGSYIHMSMNRIFKSKQRLYELIIYGFLHRFYKSKIAREKYNNKTL